MVELHRPIGYVYDPQVSNGAGPSGKGWIVPDTLWGLSITEAANVHDWMYTYGNDKIEADLVFLENMIRIIDDATEFRFLHWMRTSRALKYYLAVRYFGQGAFDAAKERATTQ